MNEVAFNPSYWARLRIFFAERFPVLLGGVTSFVAVMSIFLIWVALTPGTIFKFDQTFVVAFINMYLVTLILRLCDEFKDKEVDAILFPERCLPAGKVLYEDIQKLLVAMVLLWLPLNYVFGKSPVIFTALVFYTYLFYKYFFFPKKISNDLILALVTHNPVMFLTSFYTLSLFSVDQQVDMYSTKNILIGLAFWMPSLAWETSRKIRAPKDETDYVTYSKIMGPVGACMLPLGSILIQTISLIYVSKELQYARYFQIGAIGLYLVYASVFFSFMLTKKSSLANKLRQTTEGHILFNSILLIIIAAVEVFQ
jgi:hypothetical protein